MATKVINRSTATHRLGTELVTGRVFAAMCGRVQRFGQLLQPVRANRTGKRNQHMGFGADHRTVLHVDPGHQRAFGTAQIRPEPVQ